MAYFDGMDIIWEYDNDFHRDHFPGFLTNIDPEDVDIYQKTAEHTGVDLYINDEAYDISGRRLGWLKSVHVRGMPVDLSHFWRVFNDMKNEDK